MKKDQGARPGGTAPEFRSPIANAWRRSSHLTNPLKQRRASHPVARSSVVLFKANNK
jgi:hypothetical protein